MNRNYIRKCSVSDLTDRDIQQIKHCLLKASVSCNKTTAKFYKKMYVRIKDETYSSSSQKYLLNKNFSGSNKYELSFTQKQIAFILKSLDSDKGLPGISVLKSKLKSQIKVITLEQLN